MTTTLAALYEAATSAPWELWIRGDEVIVENDDGGLLVDAGHVVKMFSDEDITFIVALVNAYAAGDLIERSKVEAAVKEGVTIAVDAMVAAGTIGILPTAPPSNRADATVTRLSERIHVLEHEADVRDEELAHVKRALALAAMAHVMLQAKHASGGFFCHDELTEIIVEKWLEQAAKSASVPRAQVEELVEAALATPTEGSKP